MARQLSIRLSPHANQRYCAKTACRLRKRRPTHTVTMAKVGKTGEHVFLVCSDCVRQYEGKMDVRVEKIAEVAG